MGKETANLLINEFETIENIKNATIEDLSKTDGIGDTIAKEIFDFFHSDENIKMLELFKELGVNPAPSEKISDEFKGLTFVLTGTLESMGRDEASDIIKKMGGKTSSSVSKNTNYVIAGANPGSKLDKAQQIGVTILTENDFLSMIGR